jgi:hypothetical protein
MPGSPLARIESTFKDKDIEEFLDIYFTRPVGYWLALVAKSLKLSPNNVTFIGIITGVAAGHLFYYSSLLVTIIGVFLKIFSNILDSTDGQLARMTHSKSEFGRLLDGVAGHIIFVNIYAHLYARYMAEGASSWMWIVILAAGICHFIQAGWADFYRNGYMYFVRGPQASEIYPQGVVAARFHALKWKRDILKKILTFIEWQYLLLMEKTNKEFQEMKAKTEKDYEKAIPSWLSHEYRKMNKPMVKYYNILTINVRQFVLIGLLLLRVPELFFIFELTVLNAVFFYAALRQEKINRSLLAAMSSASNAPSGRDKKRG